MKPAPPTRRLDRIRRKLRFKYYSIKTEKVYPG